MRDKDIMQVGIVSQTARCDKHVAVIDEFWPLFGGCSECMDRMIERGRQELIRQGWSVPDGPQAHD